MVMLDNQQLGDHWCMPNPGASQLRASATSIARAGLRDDHQVVLILDEDPELIGRHLVDQIPEAARAMASGQLAIRGSRQWYLDRPFNPRQLVNQLADAVEAAERAGYQGVRAMGDLCSLDAHLPAETIIEYETLLAPLYAAYPVMGTCVHDQSRMARHDWDELVAVHPCTTDATGTELISELRQRFRPWGIQLAGEIDILNRGVLHVVLANAEHIPGPYEIDATALRFADVEALCCLLRTAAARGGRPTVIRCSAVLAKALRALGADTIEGLMLTSGEQI